MHLSFRAKISLTIITVSMAITCVLSMVFYQQSARTVQNNYTQAQMQQLTACAKAFDDTMLDAYSACVYAVNDETLRQCIQQRDLHQIGDILDTYRSKNKNIDSISCYLPSSQTFLKVNANGLTEVQVTEEITQTLQQVLEGNDENRLSPVYARDATSVTQDNLFFYSKKAVALDGEELAQITVGVNEREIFFRCLQNKSSQDAERFILDGDRILSAADIYSLNTQITWPDSGVLVTDVAMPTTEYHIVSIAERSQITEPLRIVRNRILLIAGFLNAAFAVLIFFVVRYLMKPMEELRSSMQQVSGGNLKVRAPVYQNDEIGQLSQGFNSMIAQIEGLIEELVTEKMLKKEAEIEALQYQITPHFMYNTLNSIKYEAILQGSPNTAELLEAFIELLQLSASDRGAFITVKQEMHMVQNYVKLQQFRYADCFQVTFDMQPEAETCYVPRLLIQPLVENAILHGIDHRKRDNQIAIFVLCDNGALAIKVEDHGEGMTSEEIQKLLDGQRKSKFSGIGVSNIRERLRLYYGEKAELRFYSEKQAGTTAVILIPISYDAEEYTI
ncbi:MAG: sensor histidine kinase [Butyricicoccus sp.]|nr:sensor histidine kinase [Butyricicoccus sp.]